MADDTPDTRYLAAAKAGDLPALDAALTDGADMYATEGGLCAMSIAIQNNKTDIAADLLARHFNPDFASEGHATTPLMVACGWGRTDIAKMLIDRGADLSRTNAHGDDALCWAVEYGYKEAVDLLLDAGADPARARNYGVVLARDPRLKEIVSYLDASTDEKGQGDRWGKKLAQSLREGLPQDIGVRVLRLKNSGPSFMKMTL